MPCTESPKKLHYANGIFNSPVGFFKGKERIIPVSETVPGSGKTYGTFYIRFVIGKLWVG